MRCVFMIGAGLCCLACSSSDSSDGTSGNGGAEGTSDGAGTAAASAIGDGAGAATGEGSGAAAADGAGASASASGTDGSAAAAANGTGSTAGDLDAGVGTAAAPADDWDATVDFDACEQVRGDTERSPAILQFVIDKSCSMKEDAPSTNGASKWEATVQALIEQWPTMDPSLAVGAFFYPNTNDGCVEGTALSVPIAPLDDAQVQALIAGTDAAAPDQCGTPTHDAWRAGLLQLQEFMASPPAGYEGAQGYLVLMTDGMPVRTLNCGSAAGDNIAVTEEQFDEYIQDVATTTAAAGLQTFVIAVPGAENTNQVPTDPSGSGIDYVPREKLSELAIAGGTATDGCVTTGPDWCHIDMVDSTDFVSDLKAAIETVLQSVISCNFVVPELDAPNVFLDTNQVNVNYYPAGSTEPIGLVRSNDDCASGEWQYVNNETEILLCDSACITVQNDPAARIEVDFGCVVPL